MSSQTPDTLELTQSFFEALKKTIVEVSPKDNDPMVVYNGGIQGTDEKLLIASVFGNDALSTCGYDAFVIAHNLDSGAVTFSYENNIVTAHVDRNHTVSRREHQNSTEFYTAAAEAIIKQTDARFSSQDVISKMDPKVLAL